MGRTARQMAEIQRDSYEAFTENLTAAQRRTKAADALIASAYLAGTNTRRVRRALAALFGGAVGNATAGSTVVDRNLDRITVAAGVIFAFTTLILAIRLQ